MTLQAGDFLSKELFVNKEPVTFRYLSRELAIHVNEAKKELETFYTRSNKQVIHATYLLIGDVNAESAPACTDKMDVDTIGQDNTSLRRKLLLVGENELEEARRQFVQPPSSHIYSLSPVLLTDAALLVSMTDRIRPMDVEKGREYNQSLGMIISPDVQTGEIKSQPAVLTKVVAATKSKLPTSVKGDNVANDVKKETPKPPGKKVNTLNWSKAPLKTTKIKETAPDTKEPSSEVSSEGTKKDAKNAQSKSGTKRPSDAIGASDSERVKPPMPRRSSLSPPSKHERKKIVLSEDDEDGDSNLSRPLPHANKGKKRVFVSDEEEEEEKPDVGITEDCNDNATVRRTQMETEGDEAILDDPAIPPTVKSKRKPKQVIPKGRNGLPKRAVTKTRKTKNAKGYTVTEDYLSYESVSESEAPASLDKVQKGISESTKNRNSMSQSEAKVSKAESIQANDEGKGKKNTGKKKDLNSYFTKK